MLPKSAIKCKLRDASDLIFSIVIFWPLTIVLTVILTVIRNLVQCALDCLYSEKVTLATGADALFGHECPGNSAVIHSVTVMSGRADLSAIRRCYTTRVFTYKDLSFGHNASPVYSKLKHVLCLRFGFYCWTDQKVAFDLENHVRFIGPNDIPPNCDITSGVTEENLMSILSHLMTTSGSMGVNSKRPQWEHIVIPNFRWRTSDQPHFACVFRLHHAYMDGVSLGILMDTVLTESPVHFAVHPMKPFPGDSFSRRTAMNINAACFGPCAFLRTLLSARKDRNHALCRHEGYSSVKLCNWTKPFDLLLLKEVKMRSGASIPGILTTALNGAISRRFLVKDRRDLNHELVLNTAVMAAMLPYKDKSLQNQFSTFSIPFPVSEDHAVKRLKDTDAVSRLTSSSSPEPVFNYHLLRWAGQLPRVAQDYLLEMAGTPVLFSNVPGIEKTCKMFGGTMVDGAGWLPLFRAFGLGVLTYSFNGKVRLCVTADGSLFRNSADLKSFLGDIEMELGNLTKYYGLDVDGDHEDAQRTALIPPYRPYA